MFNPNSDIYNQIEAASLPILKAYHKDLLVYDRDDINTNTNNTPFLHFTGANGTYLIFKDHATIKVCEQMLNWRDNLIMYYNGVTVLTIDYMTAYGIVTAWELNNKSIIDKVNN